MDYIPLYDRAEGISEKILRDSFVANRRILDLLVKSISGERRDSIPQPTIIIGGEGTGKTWLLKALELSIINDLTGFQVVVPECVSMSFMKSFVSLIKSKTSTRDERIVILVDNLDVVMGRMTNVEQYLFRGMLNKNGAPILIGTSSVVPKALTDYDAAFFDGFAIINIGNLTMEQAMKILNIQNDNDKTRAINLLSIAGTSVRNIQLVRNIMSISHTKKEDEQILYDYLYTAMTSKLDSLPDVSRRIIIAIALSEQGLKLTELSKKLNIETYRLSSYTFKLFNHNILNKEVKNMRNATYTIADKKLSFFLKNKFGKDSFSQDITPRLGSVSLSVSETS